MQMMQELRFPEQGLYYAQAAQVPLLLLLHLQKATRMVVQPGWSGSCARVRQQGPSPGAAQHARGCALQPMLHSEKPGPRTMVLGAMLQRQSLMSTDILGKAYACKGSLGSVASIEEIHHIVTVAFVHCMRAVQCFLCSKTV